MRQPLELSGLAPALAMRSMLQRVATGPELSKDLSRDEAYLGMKLILDGRVDPVQAGVFLIALRMKRETDEETIGILEAARDATHRVTADVGDVVDIADPYDGFNRTLPASPFLPVLLAACGVPAVSHGLERVGPKFGVTHRQVLRAARMPVELSVEAAAARLSDPRIGWAYVDQSVFCPKLHELVHLRTLIVKRPAITTVENLAGPVCGERRTHLVTGYVHKPYPRIYGVLARHAGYASALLVRGTEGGVIPSLRQTGKCYFYRAQDRAGSGAPASSGLPRDAATEEDALESLEFQPGELGIEQPLRAVPLPAGLPGADGEGDERAISVNTAAAADAAAGAGTRALQGEPGPTRDALVYGAALCLWHVGRFGTLGEAADAAREALDSGRALARFEAARESVAAAIG